MLQMVKASKQKRLEKNEFCVVNVVNVVNVGITHAWDTLNSSPLIV